MKIIDQLQLHRPAENSALTIGVFDGVHEAYASCTGELRRLIFLLR